MSKFFDYPVLKLNSAYMPIEIINWQDAMILYFNEKAQILEVYKDVRIRSSSDTFDFPAVIRMLHFVKPNKQFKVFKPFTRKNIWIRDGKSCMYCGKPISLHEMTFDHVIPQSLGGRTTWNNIVSSCKKCNNKKGSKKLHETDLQLIRQPFAPVIANSYNDSIMMKVTGFRHDIPEWKDYLGF